ncbi:hypothetical protein [uncultured Pseudokineococcus sp.]|uniref:hypothetical protein n=1 Tax=uncultured Pseudokineococcus sp. TaxID=1642928 RepID=UPI002608C0DF|nr:hypothetical protein [uncultured Pseudokineococcus sp.]
MAAAGPAAVLVDVRLLVLVPLVVLGLALAALLLSTAARRLDRLHRRADGARAALVEQLVRRAAAADRLARSGLLDPASSVLLAVAAADALGEGEEVGDTATERPDEEGAHEGARVGEGRREVGRDDGRRDAGAATGPGRLTAERERAESDLSAALRAALPPEVLVPLGQDPSAAPLLEDLAAECRRLRLARRFSNEAQVQVRRRRRSRLVRWGRLAGRAPEPRTFEVDDEPPPGLLP